MRKNLKWIFLQNKGSYFALLILVIIRFVMVGVNLTMAAVLSQFTEYTVGNSSYTLLSLLAVALLMFLVEGVALVAESVLKKKNYTSVEKKVRIQTINKIQISSLQSVRKYHDAELVSRLTKDAESVADCLQNIIENLFGGCLMAVAAALYLMILNWKLAVIILFSIPIMGFITSIFSPLLQKYNSEDKRNEDSNRVQMQETILNLILTKVYQTADFMSQKVAVSYMKKKKSSIKLGVIEGVFSFLNSLTGSTVFLIIMFFGAYFAERGEFSVGGLVAVLNLLNYIVWPFSNIGDSISKINQASVSAQRIIEIQTLPVDFGATIEVGKTENAVLVENVSFGYVDDCKILDHIQLALPAHGIVGIVGKSGKGKSTFLKLLMNIFQPQSGNISIYTNDTKGNQIAYVPSEGYVFCGSIAENIAFSNEIDCDKLFACAKLANAEEFIDMMNNGYQELIGEGNNQLSSGQAQRIALARAYYSDAHIKIFDEPTSNLDLISVNCFIKAMKKISKSCLCIIVTHDETLLSVCDKLYSVGNQSIKEINRGEKGMVLKEILEE